MFPDAKTRAVPQCAAQDTKISEIMRPRVEVVAIEANSTMMDLYMLHQVG